MRFSPMLALSILGTLSSLPLTAQSAPPLGSSTAPQNLCRKYVSLEDADQNRWTLLLSTPVVIPDPEILKASSRTREGWDLPKEITPWRPRLEQNEYRKYLAVLREKMISHWKGVTYQEKFLWERRSMWLARPKYKFLPLSSGEQVKIETYLSTHRERFPGVCSDRNQATYFIEIAHLEWVASYWAANQPPATSKEVRFLQVQNNPDIGDPYEIWRRSNDSTWSWDRQPQDQSEPGPDFSCAYLFKAKPFSQDKNSRIPLYSYCPYGSNLQEVTVKMLEFLSHNPMP